MPNGLPEPAMQPLHPDRPEPPIVAGDVWVKKASGKTSVNAPRCTVEDYDPDKRKAVSYRLHSGRSYGCSERVFRRDWRPC